jgi:peroxiredoxin (alkyl hydroperoxide reductase subunit C)
MTVAETVAEPSYRGTGMPRIGDAGPAFTAVTTQGEITVPADYAEVGQRPAP